MFTLVPGRDQPAGFQERCFWPIPWIWVDYSPKRQRGSFDPGSTESLGAPFPSVGATSLSSLLSTTASSLTLSSAQSPASSFTSSWSLGPLPSVPGPQISKTWGRGQSTAAEARAPYSSQLPLGMLMTLGHTNTHNACVSVRRAGSYHRQWLLSDVLTCPFIAASVSPSMAPQQLLMWP